jgi:hypothetical protein
VRALLLLCALLLAGCGGAGEATAPAGPPAEPPPQAAQDGPPPAWIQTPEGSFWLAHSTYCWTNVCADYIAPSCENAPEIPARVGEPVRIHLRFDARSATLTHFPGGAAQPLEGLAWIVESGGAFAVFARADEGDASYAGCLVVSAGR